MVQRGGFRGPDKETPEQALTRIGRAIYQNEQIIKSAKPGSAQFKKAEAALKELRKQFDAANAEVNKKRSGAKVDAANKAKARAQEDLDRANALGDEEAAQKARDRIKKAEEDILGAGDTGTADKAKDTDGDGVPDITDNLPLTPNKDQKTGTGTTKPKVTTASTAGAKGSAGAGTGDGDKGGNTADNKQLWISYLRTVFDTLEDKNQKAELDRIFATAKAQKWDEKTFMENLKNTAWWQQTLPSLRQFLLESKDPRNAGMFAEKVKNNIDSITSKLEALGIARTKVDPVTGKIIDNTDYIKGVALQAIQNNWTDDQLENWLATKGDFIFTGGGTIGSSYDRVNQMAYMYGIALDDNMKKAINTSLLDPLDGRDAQYWVNSVKQMAYDAPQNKPFSEALRAGRSLYEVTSSYRNQMASLLEVDSTAITWDDLMGKVLDKDSGNARTFADFTKALKQDPLWQYTRNAKETYSGMALDLAKMFGFAG
jgi:hypothetical protein